MKIIIAIGTAVLLILAYSCNSKVPDIDKSIATVNYDLAAGFNLAESYCFSCHSPNASIDTRIAPPMAAIKKHYITEGVNEEAFAQAIFDFVKKPSEELSKMPGAIAKFKLMPQMNFSEEIILQIAHYIYNTEIEQPDWFEEHYQQERNKYFGQNNTDTLNYMEQGLQYALATKAILGKNLLTAINEKGTAEALSFCNSKAIHLTDSMSQAQGVYIKRVSDQERNPSNKANEQELAYINASKASIKLGEQASPLVVDSANKVLGYYPIMTNAMCLQCHGMKNKDIKEATLAKLEALYPEDKATGYGSDELRGIWVIEWTK